MTRKNPNNPLLEEKTAGANLTFLGIVTTLIELFEMRDEVADDTHLAPDEQRLSLEAIDQDIRSYIVRELSKAGAIVHNLTEFRRRIGKRSDKRWEEEGPIDLEIARLKRLKQTWIARYDRLEEYVISALKFRAQQGQALVRGDLGGLKLAKSPDKVDIRQPELVPDEYMRRSVTLDGATWRRILDALDDYGEDHAREKLETLLDAKPGEPMLSEIGQQLKAGIGVPGAVLLTERVRLKID